MGNVQRLTIGFVVLCFTIVFGQSQSFAVSTPQVQMVKKVMPSVVGIGVDKQGFSGYRFSGPNVLEEFRKNYRQEEKSFKERAKPQWDRKKDRQTTEDIQVIGSGFIVDPAGKVITNAHVVQGQRAVFVLTSDGNVYRGRVSGLSEEDDVAVIQIEGATKAFAAIALGNSDAVEIAEPVIAIGNPFGLTFTVTSGIVSAFRRSVGFRDLIQTDASINHGNSGGPLINMNGEVIGINQSIFDPAGKSKGVGGNVGIGFAVPINRAKALLTGAPKKEGSSSYIGVQVAMTETGTEVTYVDDGGPAARAGILEGDLIVAVDGKRLRSVQEFSGYLKQKRVGEKIIITISRRGVVRNIAVIVGRKVA